MQYRRYKHRLPITRIALVIIGIFFVTATVVFAQHNQKSLPKKAIAKNVVPTVVTPTQKPTPIPTKKVVKTKSTPTPTPAITRAIGGVESLTVTPTVSIAQPTATPMPTAVPTIPPATGGSLLDQVNAYRASQGLGPVQTSAETCAFAATRAQEIASNFSHDLFNSRISSNTLPYAQWTAATENIAQTPNQQNVVPMWINSPGHAANMRADTPYVCIQQNGNFYAYEGMHQ